MQKIYMTYKTEYNDLNKCEFQKDGDDCYNKHHVIRYKGFSCILTMVAERGSDPRTSGLEGRACNSAKSW